MAIGYVYATTAEGEPALERRRSALRAALGRRHACMRIARPAGAIPGRSWRHAPGLCSMARSWWSGASSGSDAPCITLFASWMS
jgi:hypothetical protein